MNICDYIKAIEPPINVWGFARELGISVLEANLKDGITSVFVISNKKHFGYRKVIILNKKCKVEKQAFAIAHAISHYLLHCNDNNDFFELYNYDEQSKSEIEEQADNLALEILVPKDLFRTYEKILKYDSVKLDCLSKIFAVDRSLIRKRMM